jgi:hypothetical protein
MTAEEILNTSSLLIKSDCVIIDGVLYERCEDPGLDYFFGAPCTTYRYFLDVDDYDYLDPAFRPEDAAKIAALDKHFKK